MPTVGRERIARIGLAGVALAAVLAATFGVGYRASHSLLAGSGAFVQKGHTVVHVNAESATVDAEAARDLATGRERLEVVQTDPETVWVVNHTTGRVTRLPTATMTPTDAPQKLRTPARARVMTGGGQGYVVDPDSGTLNRLDSTSGQAQRVELPDKVTQVVVDSKGKAWAFAPKTGELYQVANGRLTDRTKVAEPQERSARLALVKDQPVVYRPAAGSITVASAAGGHPTSIPAPQKQGAVRLGVGPTDRPLLTALVPSTGELYVADIASGTVRATDVLEPYAGSGLGDPVVLGDRIYVPDQRLRQIAVLDLTSLRLRDTVSMPSGKDPFELFIRDGRVWANDPYAPTMLVFDRAGVPTTIDKGTGDGVGGDDGPVDEPTEPEPEESTTPPAEPPPAEPPPAEPPARRKVTVPEFPTGRRTRRRARGSGNWSLPARRLRSARTCPGSGRMRSSTRFRRQVRRSRSAAVWSSDTSDRSRFRPWSGAVRLPRVTSSRRAALPAKRTRRQSPRRGPSNS